MKSTTKLILLSCAVLFLVIGLGFVLVSMSTDVSAYGGTVRLYEGELHYVDVPLGSKLEIADPSLLRIESQSEDEDSVKYSISALQEGYTTITVTQYFAGFFGHKAAYYDVFVSNSVKASTKVELKNVDTGEKILVQEDTDKQIVQLEFGAEYSILLNGQELNSSPLLPCSALTLTDISSDGVRRKNITLNEHDNLLVNGAQRGSFSLTSDLIGELTVEYSVISKYIPLQDIARTYSKTYGDEFKANELTVAMTSDLVNMQVTNLSPINQISNKYLKRVFPNLKELTVIVYAGSTKNVGLINLPEQIERLTFEVNGQKPITPTVLIGQFKGQRGASLHVTFDGALTVQPYCPDPNQPCALFSSFKELTVETKNGNVNLSTKDLQTPSPIFTDIRNLTLEIYTYEDLNGSQHRYYANIETTDGTATHKNGADAIVCTQLTIHLGGNLNISAGDGANGVAGKSGAQGTNSAYDGQHGTNGTDGGNGGNAIFVSTLTVTQTNDNRKSFTIFAGSGGDGGDGGNGGDGYKCTKNVFQHCNAGDGGNAARGGHGGASGYAIYVTHSISADPNLLSNAECGQAGRGGFNGNPGDAGYCGTLFHGKGDPGEHPSEITLPGRQNDFFYRGSELNKTEFFNTLEQEYPS